MDLDLTSDQELMRDTAAKFIRSACPLVEVRRLADSETGLPADYLRQTGELGWYAMLVPEEHGGGSISGAGVSDLAIIAEERGRGLQPGPFVPMNVVASALASGGTPAQQEKILPALAAGETVVTWALSGPTGAPGAPVAAMATGDDFLLTGEAGLVQDASLAEWILVSAGEGAQSQFLVAADAPGVTIRAVKGHDITQRFASVAFDQVRVSGVDMVGRAGEGATDSERQLQVALVLSVAETIGALDALFEMTRQYALDRIAFGRPIGSFQGVKHQLADMSLSLEAGKAVANAATDAVQAEQSDAGEIASMAKAWVGDVGIDIVQGCSQVFGGIGQTWEHDSHLFLRRVTMNSLLFGQPDWHRERICVIHGF